MTGSALPRGTRRLHWLDALRGIAAMAVVLGHYYWGMIDFPQHTFFDPGLFGVAVFFFISGYIVPLSVRIDRDRPAFRPAFRFAWSRFFRLYPLYWLSLAVGIVVFDPTLRQALVNLTMMQRLVGVDDVVNVYWTLQIEIIFYGLILLTILTRRFNHPPLVIKFAIAFGVLSVLFGFARFYFQLRAPLSVPIGLTVIFVGNLTSLSDTGGLSRSAFRRTALCAAALLIASFYLGYNQDWGHEERPERFVISYAAAVALFYGAARLHRWRFPVAVSVGAISYPIYLIHQPMREIAANLFTGTDPAVRDLIALVAVMIVAWILHVVIEKPSVRLGRALLSAGPPHQSVARFVAEPLRFWTR